MKWPFLLWRSVGGSTRVGRASASDSARERQQHVVSDGYNRSLRASHRIRHLLSRQTTSSATKKCSRRMAHSTAADQTMMTATRSLAPFKHIDAFHGNISTFSSINFRVVGREKGTRRCCVTGAAPPVRWFSCSWAVPFTFFSK